MARLPGCQASGENGRIQGYEGSSAANLETSGRLRDSGCGQRFLHGLVRPPVGQRKGNLGGAVDDL